MRILSIDPGLSSGFALGYFDDDTPYTLLQAWQTEGGVAGIEKWLDHNWGEDGSMSDRIVCEKFVPLQNAGFAQTLDSTYPLVCEGFLIARGIISDYRVNPKGYQRPAEMYFAGGVDFADKKKRAYAMLKGIGMHVTGKRVGCKDANDARSAILHAIAYVMKVEKHRPTWDCVNYQLEKGTNDGV